MDDRIPPNLRTLMILEVLGQSDQAMTATEINETLGLPKQTVHRLCATLEANGFLTRPDKGKRYVPSHRLRSLGTGLLHASRAHIVRHQILQDVARQVRETVNYVVPEDTGMSYVDRVETDWPFRIQLPVGSNVPFHCTASGKAFMASLPLKARNSFVASLNLEGLTPRTHTNPNEVLAELSDVARLGYALDNEEFMEGMVAIAVPVLDHKHRYIASLAFHGPQQRIDMQDAIARKDILIDGARRLTDALLGT